MNAEVSSARSARLLRVLVHEYSSETIGDPLRARRVFVGIRHDEGVQTARFARSGHWVGYADVDVPSQLPDLGVLRRRRRQLLLLHDAVEDRHAQQLLGNGPQAFLVVEGRRGIDEIW